MALVNIYKNYPLRNYIYSAFVVIRRKSIVVEFDALDDFTTQLMQKKSDKWENFKIRKQFPSLNQKIIAEVQILGDKLNGINTNELNLIFQTFLDDQNEHKVAALIDECIIYKRIPSDLILMNILSYFALNTNINGINKIKELCSITNPTFLKAHSNLTHYLAEVIWLKGDVLKAIKMFEGVYHENPFLRRRVRLMLKYLIPDSVSNNSEAVLVNLVKLSEKLVEKYKDYFIMMCLWQACFLSEWFADQQMSIELLERNEGLRKIITNQIPYVVYASLKYHKTEPVYRLLEMLLKYNMNLQYSIVLIALFDYKYKQGDFTSCCEILNWSTENNIILPSIQHERFLKLLLKCDSMKKEEKQPVSQYDLKF